jgi:hypothetical protein
MFDFRLNTSIPYLNQGQGSVFKVRECAQSIPRLEKPKNWRFSHKNPKIFDFRFNTPISLNQGQRSVFMLRECAQSISHLEKPKNRRFSRKNPKMFDFRFNTPIPSLNQGQGSIFKVRECAQSIPRIKLPLKGHLLKNFFKFSTRPYFGPHFSRSDLKPDPLPHHSSAKSRIIKVEQFLPFGLRVSHIKRD